MSEVISLLSDDETDVDPCERMCKEALEGFAKFQYPLAWYIDHLQKVRREHPSLLGYVKEQILEVARDPNLFSIFWIIKAERLEVCMTYWVLFVKHLIGNFLNRKSLVPTNIELSLGDRSIEGMAPTKPLIEADPEFSFDEVRDFIASEVSPERSGDGAAIREDIWRYVRETFVVEDEKLEKSHYHMPFWVDTEVVEEEFPERIFMYFSEVEWRVEDMGQYLKLPCASAQKEAPKRGLVDTTQRRVKQRALG